MEMFRVHLVRGHCCLRFSTSFAVSAWQVPALLAGARSDTALYGTAVAISWDRVHPRLTHRGCWIYHTGELPRGSRTVAEPWPGMSSYLVRG